ncbi:MAG: hypothetical protein HY898_26445 [Deltaproteobacteria bacterium]|nr:hypothetical protein [Deltaproteobacteria bacterium]
MGRSASGGMAIAAIASAAIACGGRTTVHVEPTSPDAASVTGDSGPEVDSGHDSAMPDAAADASYEQDVASEDVQWPAIPGDPWRQYRHDARRTGLSTVTVASHPIFAWSADLECKSYDVAPVVDATGNVYVAACGVVWSLDNKGAVRWREPEVLGDAGWAPYLAIALTSDDRLVAVDVIESSVKVLEPTGKLVHATNLPNEGNLGALLLSADNSVYITSTGPALDSVRLHAINEAGALLWSADLAQSAQIRGLSADNEGNVYVAIAQWAGAEWTTLVKKVSADGKGAWTQTWLGLGFEPVVAASGRAWLALHTTAKEAPNLVLLDLASEQALAKIENVGLVAPLPALGQDQILYVGTPWGLSAWAPNGDKLWMVGSLESKAMDLWTGPVLSADGTVIVSDTIGFLHGIRDKKIAWSYQRDWQDEPDPNGMLGDQVAIGPDGTIYAGSYSGLLYALR